MEGEETSDMEPFEGRMPNPRRVRVSPRLDSAPSASGRSPDITRHLQNETTIIELFTELIVDRSS